MNLIAVKGAGQIGPMLPCWDELRQREINFQESWRERHVSRQDDAPPLLYRSAGWLLRRLAPDSAARRLFDLDWADCLDLIKAQSRRNEVLRLRRHDPALLQATWDTEASGLNRPYSQLPCTKRTVADRVAKAKLLTRSDDRILLLGDDDMVSIGLAEAGHGRVVVLDIDSNVIDAIRQSTAQYGSQVRALCHDLTNPLPAFARAPAASLVFMDPGYSIEGVKLFLEPAVAAIRDKPFAHIFMSVNLLSLGQDGLTELQALIDRAGLDVEDIKMGFNCYPIPRALRKVTNFAARVFLPGLSTNRKEPFDYFFSDALILKRR